MYAHDDIWNAVDRLADTFGYSPSGLAKKAGLDPTSFNKSKRISADGKPRWPSTESVAKILAVTGMTMSEFFSMADGGKGKTLPLIEITKAGQPGIIDEKGIPAGKGWKNAELEGFGGSMPDCFALEIRGGDYAPVYRDGNVIVVSPSAALRRGDRIVCAMRNGKAFAAELVRQTGSQTTLRPISGNGSETTLNESEISWIARVIWASQ